MSSADSPPSTATPVPARLVSLDAFRGLIMLTLLCGGIFHTLKNVPGWHWLYVQNEHVAWEGCVYWDLIQPSFMFMVGVAMPFALARRREQGHSWRQRFGHVLLRALNLILIGIILDHVGQDKIQIGFIRVLQQIAVGYVLAFLVAEKPLRVQAIAAAVILVGWTLLWMFNPWNGPGGPWAMSYENIGGAFDRWMLGRNYSGYYVGLNAIPSTATILFGVMAGELIRRGLPKTKTLAVLLIAGAAGILIGLAVSPWLPLIKRIWTPSFAVYAGGWTFLFLAFFYWIIEIRGLRRWAFPLVVAGMNSIAAYVIAGAFGQWFARVTGAWVNWLAPHMGKETWFPVFQRLLFVAFAWGVLYWLWRRRIFFKC
jgi:heparan-alpha-glucosaminide N-acetyltransferase